MILSLCLILNLFVYIYPNKVKPNNLNDQAVGHRMEFLFVILSSMEKSSDSYILESLDQWNDSLLSLSKQDLENSLPAYLKLRAHILGGYRKDKEMIKEAYSMMSKFRQYIPRIKRSDLIHAFQSRIEEWQNKFMVEVNRTIDLFKEFSHAKFLKTLNKYREANELFNESFVVNFNYERTAPRSEANE